MHSGYEEMFSCWGYDALTLILGMNPETLSEDEKKKLIQLISFSEDDQQIKDRIQEILKQEMEHSIKKTMLLSLLPK
jgi:hypothetical protein